jgi:hypothetical protein
VVLKRLAEAKAPPPELKALQEKMLKLEQLMKAAEIDEKIAGTEKDRADAFSKMAEVTSNTGLAPDVISGLFPLHYREPTFIDRLLMAASQEADMDQMRQNEPKNPMMPQPGPDGSPRTNGAPGLSQGAPQALPGEEPQLNEPGGLPIGEGVL